MVRFVLAFWVLHASAAGVPQCDSPISGEQSMIERINKRYDDFFRYRGSLEEREHLRERGRGEARDALKARAKKMEQARVDSLRTPRQRPDADTTLEAEILKKAKERKLAQEAARQCYVQQQAKAEALLKRGRQIPGNKEFDLED